MFHILLQNRGDNIKFIFPQNYNFKSKLLGIIDYNVAIFDVIWCVSIFFLLNLIFDSTKIIISLLIIFCLPIIIFSIVGFNGENISLVVKYITIYLIRPKVYVFSKKYKSF